MSPGDSASALSGEETDHSARKPDRPRMLVLEPYCGGSHEAVLDAILPRLDWPVDLLTLPARKWKWRMRGAAITMADDVRRMTAKRSRVSQGGECCAGPWDILLASTFLNLAEFKGLAGGAVAEIPSIVYFHENQLVYPSRHEAEWDLQFPLTNITSALVADRCVFNSVYNRDSFIEGIPDFLRRFPDHLPQGVAERVAAKSEVIPPPFCPEDLDGAEVIRGERPRVVWPHRWEHDKDPDTFFRVVGSLLGEGLDFEVAVLGQAFADRPEVFERARSVLGDRLVVFGAPETRAEYAQALASCDIAVSTALNEFFGIAMIEACYAGCWPLVPSRLAYPDIYPVVFRYEGEDALARRLRELVLDRPSPRAAHEIAERYTVDRLLPRYASMFREVARSTGRGA